MRDLRVEPTLKLVFLERLSAWARLLRRDGVTLWFAYRHVQTPFLAKALCILVVAYAFSPVDLIPDFIPVLGYLDEIILLPALIWLAIHTLPNMVVEESRVKADNWVAEQGRRPRKYFGAVLVVLVWVGLGVICWQLAAPLSIKRFR